MKSRALWLILALATLAAAIVAFRPRHTETPAPVAQLARVPAPVPTAPPSSAAVAAPALPPSSSPTPATTTVSNSSPAPTAPPAPGSTSKGPRPVVAIQDGKTIDFSSGQPFVIDADKENAALAKALQEIDEATKNTTIQPRGK